jgi:hypothetical protein
MHCYKKKNSIFTDRLILHLLKVHSFSLNIHHHHNLRQENVLLLQYLIDFQDYFVLIHHLLHIHQYLDHDYQQMVLQVLNVLMELLFVVNDNFHHYINFLLKMN